MSQHSPLIKYNFNKWARNYKKKAKIFAKHLCEVFQPYPSEAITEENVIENYLEAPFQMDFAYGKIKTKGITRIIKEEINIKKDTEFDLIAGKVLQDLSPKCLKIISFIFNAILKTNYFTTTWNFPI